RSACAPTVAHHPPDLSLLPPLPSCLRASVPPCLLQSPRGTHTPSAPSSAVRAPPPRTPRNRARRQSLPRPHSSAPHVAASRGAAHSAGPTAAAPATRAAC